MKLMFSGGSFDNPLFQHISRQQIVNVSSSKQTLLNFVMALGYEIDDADDLMEAIEESIDRYNSYSNMSIADVQKEMLDAFDNNSIFYFIKWEEGLSSFISFADAESIKTFEQ